jgi:hypothetical protein
VQELERFREGVSQLLYFELEITAVTRSKNHARGEEISKQGDSHTSRTGIPRWNERLVTSGDSVNTGRGAVVAAS